MLTTSQTTLEAGFVEDEGMVCATCLLKETGLDNLGDLRIWMAGNREVFPVIEYELHEMADPDGLYCYRCGKVLVDPSCPKCGGTLFGSNEGTGESDDDGFLLCAGCCTKLDDEADLA